MIKAHKRIGQTPLELLEEIRSNNPKLKNEKMSYAGRLDPMAVGEMLIMVGKKENSQREKYLKFDKTYEADILFGFSTDSHDLLGIVESISTKVISTNELKAALKILKKIKKIKYPVFSSKNVKGKPLFEWKKTGKINEIKIPERDIKIKKLKLIQNYEIKGIKLWNYINFSINEVKGDFRQKEILDKWYEILSENNNLYQVSKIRFKVSSGTYIRSLADILGKEMETAGCLLSLNRIRIHRKTLYKS